MEPIEFISSRSGRLLTALLQARPGLKGGAVLTALKKGRIKVNGKRVDKDCALAPNDSVWALLPPSPPPPIVYRDAHILIADKPQGIPVCDSRSGEATLEDWLAAATGAPVYPLHRLDHHTSGLVCFAATARDRDALDALLRDGHMQKTYRCVVCGKPPVFRDAHAHLAKEAAYSTVRVADMPFSGSKPIHTQFRLLEQRGDTALLEVILFTGRTHQIRAHLAHLGYPVLGDDKYGNRRMNQLHHVQRQQLRACRICFTGMPEPYADLNRSFQADLEPPFTVNMG